MVVVITLVFGFEEAQSGSAIYYTKKKKKEGRRGSKGEREGEREGEEDGEEEGKKKRRHLKQTANR